MRGLFRSPQANEGALRTQLSHERNDQMPIYEYRCGDCGHEFETIQKISEAPLTRCPACEHEALSKKVSRAAFRLKGAGWYETDFKSGNKRNVASAGDSSPGGGSGSDSSGGEKPSGEKSSTEKSSGKKAGGDKSSSDKSTSGTTAKSAAASGAGSKSSGSGSGSGSGSSGGAA